MKATVQRIIQFARRPAASQRLICFPYSGGAASVFRSWSDAVPQHIEVCAVEYPGHGSRVGERPIDSVSGLVEEAGGSLATLLDRPFSVLGYSLGALVAFEWLHRLAAAGGPRASRLFVCAHRAPGLPAVQPLLHDLPDSDMVDGVQRRYGGIPSAVLNEPELLALLLPSLRADLKAYELYPRRERAPLPLPIHAFGGTLDRTISRDDMAAWKSYTTQAFTLDMVEGDHFFITSNRSVLQTMVVDKMISAVQPTQS